MNVCGVLVEFLVFTPFQILVDNEIPKGVDSATTQKPIVCIQGGFGAKLRAPVNLSYVKCRQSAFIRVDVAGVSIARDSEILFLGKLPV